MSIWDWAQGGMGIGDTTIGDFKGSYKVTAGTALSAFFGGRHTHLFGPEIKLVMDPEDMLGQLFPPCVTGMLSGLTGNATFTYGSSTSATYIGPKVDIQRAPKISRVSTKFVTRPGTGAAGTWTENPADQNDPLDKASAVAVGALSTLAIAVAAGLELAMYIHYRDFTDSTQGPGVAPKLLSVYSYAMPSRALALVKVIETAACYGSWAEVSMIKAGDLAAREAIMASGRNLITRIQTAYLAWQERRAQQALEAGEDAAEDVVE